MKLVLFTPLCLRLKELSDQPLTSLSLTFCLCVSVLKPSWNKGLCHRLPGRSAPGVVRPILFLLIDHRPANTTIQHVNRTFKKKERKRKNRWKKNKQKTGKNLQTICYLSSLIDSGINPLWNQSTETVNPGLRIASPRRVDQTHRTWCRWFPLLGETPRFSTSCRWPRPKWIEPDRDIKCHRSDLIWLFDSLWLFHCGGVSLVVQWQWSSVCLMFISFLYSSTYFAVSWN